MDTEDSGPCPDEDMYDDGGIKRVAEKWITFFEKVPLSAVPFGIMDTISEHFDHKEWKKLAVQLKVDNPQTLKVISGNAKAKEEWASRVLLQHCADHYPEITFSKLLTELEEMGRTAVWTSLDRSGQVADFMHTYGQPSRDDCEKVAAKFHLFADHRGDALNQHLRELVTAAVNVTDALSDLNGGGQRPFRTVEKLQQNNSQWPAKDGNETEKQNDNVGDNDEKKAPLSDRSLRSAKSPSPAEKKFAVMLTYSEDVNHLVPEVVQRLWDCGIGVVSEYTLKGRGYFEANHVSSWEGFFRQCHLVVPIISKQYLLDIKSPSDSYQSKGVRFVFDLFTRKYVRDGCVNKKVRPLVVDDLRGAKLSGINPTLEIRWKLKKEIEDFLQVLVNRKTTVLGYKSFKKPIVNSMSQRITAI